MKAGAGRPSAVRMAATSASSVTRASSESKPNSIARGEALRIGREQEA